MRANFGAVRRHRMSWDRNERDFQISATTKFAMVKREPRRRGHIAVNSPHFATLSPFRGGELVLPRCELADP